MKALIDSKELAVGAWVRTDGEIARITSLYKHIVTCFVFNIETILKC